MARALNPVAREKLRNRHDGCPTFPKSTAFSLQEHEFGPQFSDLDDVYLSGRHEVREKKCVRFSESMGVYRARERQECPF